MVTTSEEKKWQLFCAAVAADKINPFSKEEVKSKFKLIEEVVDAIKEKASPDFTIIEN